MAWLVADKLHISPIAVWNNSCKYVHWGGTVQWVTWIWGIQREDWNGSSAGWISRQPSQITTSWTQRWGIMRQQPWHPSLPTHQKKFLSTISGSAWCIMIGYFWRKVCQLALLTMTTFCIPGPGKPLRCLLSFSAYHNGAKLLSVSGLSKDRALAPIHGIRFISMTWVILAHTIYFGLTSASVGKPHCWIANLGMVWWSMSHSFGDTTNKTTESSLPSSCSSKPNHLPQLDARFCLPSHQQWLCLSGHLLPS